MRLLLYDDVDTGHHPGYIAGIVEAAERRGLDFAVASARRPPTLITGDWIEVESHPLRSVLANRRQLAWAREVAQSKGTSTLVDLYLDKQIWAVAPRRLETSVHVLHHAEQYSVADRSGPAALRTRYLRRRMGGLAGRGAVFVVHTRRTAEILAYALPRPPLQAGYPVRPIPHRPRELPDGPPTMLFVGAGRKEKGLDLLLGAMSRHPDLVSLRIVGRQPPGLRAALSERFAAVSATWVDEYVDDEALHREYQAAHLAVLPYRAIFGRHGGPSSVLLETFSAGLPVVTTTALAEQLPTGYSGAVVTSANSVSDLEAAITAAVGDLRQLSAAAADEGPRFIAANHTFDSYLDRLLDAVRLARGE